MAEAAVRIDPAASESEMLSTTFDAAYTWNYGVVRQDLRNLYEKSKRDQWNATDQLAWETSVDPEAELVPDFQIPIYGTHIWEKLTPGEIKKLRREALAWTLSQFMHGEQGALLATAQIVDAVPSFDAKLYGAAQVIDEARHVEVYARYLREKLTRQYPCNQHLKSLLDLILTDGRWDMKYLGMQIMVEGLAMAAFGYMHKVCSEPLLTDLTHYVMKDEARHVAFGVLALQELLQRPPRQGASRPRGVPLRGLPADARPAAHGGRLGGDGLDRRRGPRDRAPLRADEGIPQDALLEDRAQREASRAADALGPRALRRARHPQVRARGSVGLNPGSRAATAATLRVAVATLTPSSSDGQPSHAVATAPAASPHAAQLAMPAAWPRRLRASAARRSDAIA